MNATEAAEKSKIVLTTLTDNVIRIIHSQIEESVKQGFTQAGTFVRREIQGPVADYFRDLDYRVETTSNTLTVHWSPEPAQVAEKSEPSPIRKPMLAALAGLAIIMSIAVGGVLLIAYLTHS